VRPGLIDLVIADHGGQPSGLIVTQDPHRIKGRVVAKRRDSSDGEKI